MTIILLVLLAVAAGVIQLVLWSDYPRELVVRQLQNQLGVRVELAGMQTGWLGRTRLEDLRLTMPLGDEPFLRAPAMDVRHTSLLMLLLGRPLRIDAAEVDGASITILQQPTGRWNIQSIGAGGEAGDGGSKRGADIPDLAITRGTLHVIDNRGRQTTIDGVDFRGRNESAFVYALELDLPRCASVTGRINLRDFDHRLAIDATDLATPLEPLIGGIPRPLAVEGEWIGQVRDGGLEAVAHVRGGQVMQYRLGGDVRLRFEDGALTLRPAGLLVEGGSAPRARAEEGEVRITADELSASGLRIRAGEGLVLVNGQWRFAGDGGAAAVQLAWHDVELPASVRHSGTLAARLEPQLGGARKLTADVELSGRAMSAAFDASLRLAGIGSRWEEMDWTLDASKLAVDAADYALDLDGLSARVLGRGDRLVLHHLTLPQEGRLSGEGSLVLVADRPWTLRLSGTRLPLSRYRDLAGEFALDAEGNQRRFHLKQFRLRAGELTATASGFYDAREPEPLVLTVQASHPAPGDLVVMDDPPLVGPLEAEARIHGTVDPLKLALDGQLVGRDLRTRRRHLGDVTLMFDGTIEPQQARLATTELDLLGGQWRFAATIDQRPSGGRDAHVQVTLRGLPLESAAEVFAVDGLSGTADGEWMIDLPDLRPDGLIADGRLRARDITYRPVRRDPEAIPAPATAPTGEPLVTLKSVNARMRLRDRIVRVEGLELRQQEGVARGSLVYRLIEPQVLRGEMDWSNWAVELPHSDSALHLNGSAGLTVNLAQSTLSGPIRLRADLVHAGRDLGDLRVEGEFRERAVVLPMLRGEAFGGRAWGRLQLDLDRPLESHGVLQFNGIDGAAIAATWPALGGLEGVYRGVIELRPADPENRPVAPLRLSGFVDPADGRFRATEIGPISFDSYFDTRRADRADTASRLRLVLDSARVEAMGGRFDLWGRFTRHARGEVSAQANVTFNDISLDQFWQTFVHPDEGGAATPGLVNGSATILLDPQRPRASFGEADLRLSRSDLINIGAFRLLYDLLNIAAGPAEPTGEGQVRLRLEGETLHITRMNYFNRGTEVWALGHFGRVWNMPDSTVDATVVGTARPFGTLELPVLADVQDILEILQRDLTTVRVSGTIAAPRYAQAAFEQLSRTMRDILLGDVQSKAKRK